MWSPLRRPLAARRLLHSRSPPPSTAPPLHGPDAAAGLPVPPPPSRPLLPPALAVWGADTDVGKTLVSAGLARVAAARGWRVLYVKPVQTGYPADDDAAAVARAARVPLATPGPHAAALITDRNAYDGGVGLGSYARTLAAWRAAVSPHAAAADEGRLVTGAEVAAATAAELTAWAQTVTPSRQRAFALIESAGGPLSPSPDGGAQADAWAPLRLPPLLVASPRLGGLSTTLAAAECLRSRGHGPGLAGVAVVAGAGGLPAGHASALAAGLPPGTPFTVLPPCPPPPKGWTPSPGGEADPSLAAWADGAARAGLAALLDAATAAAEGAAAALAGLPARAAAVTWWPFTQHEGLQAGRDVLAIEARAGEHYLCLTGDAAAATDATDADATVPSLTPLYDACASWWTQGATGVAGARVRWGVAAALGRYGHVIHPKAAHEPGVEAAEALLEGAGAGWGAKVFWSDDGSTAIEVGLKMAFRAAEPRTCAAAARGVPVSVLTVDGCYHGDTLAAMDATPPSVFNARQTPWYAGRALCLAPPTAGLGKGGWTVRLAGGGREAAIPGGVAELFSEARADGDVGAAYRREIAAEVDAHEAAGAGVVGAALFEPVLQGAGGMRFVDPAWQTAFVAVARARAIPVVADEVFSGLWRLGAPSGCQLLGVVPDIAAYAKLLTGGALPLAATVASQAVFDAFRGGGTEGALLHGHSYSAHAAGCGAAAAALAAYVDPTANPALCTPDRCGQTGCTSPCGRLLPMWCEAGLAAVVAHPFVDRAFALGTVLAVHLADDGAAGGYASTASAGVAARLRREGVYARPLGDALYLMQGPTSDPGGGRAQGRLLTAALVRALG